MTFQTLPFDPFNTAIERGTMLISSLNMDREVKGIELVNGRALI
jgi:hypothetical protein